MVLLLSVSDVEERKHSVRLGAPTYNEQSLINISFIFI
ncbi:hypothetical protein BURCENBC7_AP0512 [Burkholderia cenocepacia BC7]|nr:hypothetical protein BURCENBC7_AP0512 [Burkholderia cenocepacia BC7]